MRKILPRRVAIIGGSGLYSSDAIKNPKEIRIKTPFGAHSGPIVIGELSGVACAFLPRHGRGHTLAPSEINQRANIWALKSLGVERILAFAAVGSLHLELPPCTFVIPDQLVDRTKNRVGTFFGNGIVAHVAMEPPFAPAQSRAVLEAAHTLGIDARMGGTYVCIDGPGFSTRAESEFHRAQGWSLVGMTACPEAKLAREAELSYCLVAMVTDYDSWKHGEEVTSELVVTTMRSNILAAQKLIAVAVPRIAETPLDPRFSQALKGALVTDRKSLSRITLKKLNLLISTYIS